MRKPLTHKIYYGRRDVYKAYWWSLTGGRKWMVRYHKTKYHVPYNIFKGIVGDFNEAVIRGEMIDKGLSFKIPHFGEIMYRKYKPKIWYDDKGVLRKDKLPVDWPKTWALWAKMYPGLTKAELKQTHNKKVVYNMNAHTDGYRFKFFWFKGRCRVVNSTAYSLRLPRVHNRYLAKRAKDPENGIDFNSNP